MIKYITPWFLPKEEYQYWDLYSDKFINHFFGDGDKYKKIVWFHPSEYNRIIEDKNALQKINDKCNLEIWLGNFNNDNPQQVINWSMWTWQYSYYNYINYENKQGLEIDKLFVCLNRKSKYHRCILADELAKNNLIDKGYFTWHRLDISDNHMPWKRYDFKYFDNKTRQLEDIVNNKIPYADEGFVVTGDYFTKGLIHVLPEAIVDDCMFIGMKFAQVCLHKRPYLFLGTKGIHKLIKDLGFELYTELFDYSFDLEESTQVRVEGITKNLVNLQNQNFKDLFNCIKDKIEFNYNHFITLVKNKENIPHEFWNIDDSMPNINFFKRIVDTCLK
jgi:hypothetical protein